MDGMLRALAPIDHQLDRSVRQERSNPPNEVPINPQLGHPADELSGVDVVEGPFDVHQQCACQLSVGPRMLHILDQTGHGIDGASISPTTHLSWV